MKLLSVFISLSLIFHSICLAGDDFWGKPYRANFKSPENYTSLKRLKEREKELERWQERQRRASSWANNEQTAKIKLPEKPPQPQALKPKFTPRELPKPAEPHSRVTFEKKFVDGKWHSVKTVERYDKWGNLARRDVLDRVRLDKKTTLTTIKSYSPSGDLIRQIEKLKIRGKGGNQIQKYVATEFDGRGNPLNRMLVKNEFQRSGFFNTPAGKLLGMALVTAASVFLPPAIAALGTQIVQMGLSLAQGQSLKNALVSAGISLAAGILGKHLAAIAGKFQSAARQAKSAYALFDPRTEAGRANLDFAAQIQPLGAGRPDALFTAPDNTLLAARYGAQYLAPASRVREILSKFAIVKIKDDFSGATWELRADNFDVSKGVNVYLHGWNADPESNKIIKWGITPHERFNAVGDKRSAVIVLWNSGKWNSVQGNSLNTFKLGISNADKAAEPAQQLLQEIFEQVKKANPDATTNVIGHSLAARVILGAAKKAAQKNSLLADHIALLSPAVENTALNQARPRWWGAAPEGEFYKAHQAAKSIVNVYSRQDEALLPPVYQLFSPGPTHSALGKDGASKEGFYLPKNVYQIDASLRYDVGKHYGEGAYFHSSYVKSGFNQVRFIYEDLLKKFESGGHNT